MVLLSRDGNLTETQQHIVAETETTEITVAFELQAQNSNNPIKKSEPFRRSTVLDNLPYLFPTVAVTMLSCFYYSLILTITATTSTTFDYNYNYNYNEFTSHVSFVGSTT